MAFVGILAGFSPRSWLNTSTIRASMFRSSGRASVTMTLSRSSSAFFVKITAYLLLYFTTRYVLDRMGSGVYSTLFFSKIIS